MSPDAPRFTQIDLAEIAFSATAALWDLLVVSVHESGTLVQELTSEEACLTAPCARRVCPPP